MGANITLQSTFTQYTCPVTSVAMESTQKLLGMKFGEGMVNDS